MRVMGEWVTDLAEGSDIVRVEGFEGRWDEYFEFECLTMSVKNK